MGARASGDGNCAQLPFATNNKGPFIEMSELRYPILFEEYSFNEPDSAGPGKYRGGMGTRLIWRLRGKEAELSALSERHKISPYGVFEGLPPMPRECGHFSDTRLKAKEETIFTHATELFGKASPSKWSNVTINEGDRVEIVLSGGGGWGAPFEREPEAVLSDVMNGYVSLAGAKDHYGVVIDPDTMTIDREATSKLRERMREHHPKLELSTRIKVHLSILMKFGESRTPDIATVKSSEGVVFVGSWAEGLLIKVEGTSLAQAFLTATELKEKLGAREILFLTTQFVPSDFQTPRPPR